MARLYLSPGENAYLSNTPTPTIVFGTEAVETVFANANAVGTLDPSFSSGGDVINIAGNAALYSGTRSGSNLILTAANGARLIIPVGTVGATIKFADADPRTLRYDEAISAFVLGEQVLNNFATVPIVAGGTTGGGDPVVTIIQNPGGGALYRFGAGNDTLDSRPGKATMSGTGRLTVELGDGNDSASVRIGDGFGVMQGAANVTSIYATPSVDGSGRQIVQTWYHNHVVLDNLTVSGGDGDDVVRTWGASAARIDLGAGNDAAFTDNSGTDTSLYNAFRATWVFNTLNANVDALQSRTAISFDHVANLSLTVRYQGLEATVVVGDSASALGGVTVSDQTINQAIKAAINADPVLGKLLVAEDGPARTLVVRALIDGEHVAADLAVSLGITGPLSLAQQAEGGLLLGAGFDPTPMGFDGTGTALAGGRFISGFGMDGLLLTLRGVDSVNVNGNIVEGGAGDDLVVLSSNGAGDGIGAAGSTVDGFSVETLVMRGAFGADTVVNFTAGTGDGYDIFDLSGLLGGAPTGFAVNDSDNTEQATINSLSLDDRNVIIIDQVEIGDPGVAEATERERLEELLRANDPVSINAKDSVIITIDQATNIGTFYHAANGTSAADVMVTLLGSVELATYLDGDKAAIGDWQAMMPANFTPLSRVDLTGTYAIA